MSRSAVSIGLSHRVSALPSAALSSRRLELGEGDGLVLTERADPGPPQRCDVAVSTERTAEIAGKRAHIGALAAFALEHGNGRRPAVR